MDLPLFGPLKALVRIHLACTTLTVLEGHFFHVLEGAKKVEDIDVSNAHGFHAQSQRRRQEVRDR